jgi:trehalose/maltose transport system substrate-binding protein
VFAFERRHPEVAAVLLVTSVRQKSKKSTRDRHAAAPNRPDLYRDQDVLAITPGFANVLEILNSAVARPSTITGADYNRLSRAIFQNAKKALSGGESARDAVAQIEQTAQSMQR